MEVFKAAFSEGSNASDRIAIKANGKSYSYGQLTSSALTISKLFHKEDTKNVCLGDLFEVLLLFILLFHFLYFLYLFFALLLGR